MFSSSTDISVPNAPPTAAYAAYEAIVAALAEPAMADAVRALRDEREARTGVMDSEDEGFESRMQAFWDAAVTTPSLLALLHDRVAPGIAPWLGSFARAHRGLFRVQSRERLHLVDVWSGAEFTLAPRPPREQALALESEGLFDGRLVGAAAPTSITLLPGAVFHPADATGAIERVLEAARAQSLSRDDTLDALLRMEARLRAHSRVKPSYAYRPDTLRLARPQS